MRISCLQLVREATLQILRLRSYILFQMLRDKTIFFSRIPRRTFAITDTKFPSEGVPEGVDCIRVVKILFFVSKPQWSQKPTKG